MFGQEEGIQKLHSDVGVVSVMGGFTASWCRQAPDLDRELGSLAADTRTAQCSALRRSARCYGTPDRSSLGRRLGPARTCLQRFWNRGAALQFGPHCSSTDA